MLVNQAQSYQTSSTDADADELYYRWSWGDGTYSDWLGPYTAGEICTAEHTWPGQGQFDVRVTTRDKFYEETGWSSPLNVNVIWSCCVQSGDINYDGSTNPDIADLVYLVAYMFSGGPPPPCAASADINGSGSGPDIADLVYLVAYMFSGGPLPATCQ